MTTMTGTVMVGEVEPRQITAKEYGSSLIAFIHAGELLVEASVTVEEVRETTELYPDFKTAVKEMLKTDKQFSPRLELSNRREHNMINGQVVNVAGEPMVDVLDNGRVASGLLAEQDAGYESQVKRDEADIRTAERVDGLAEGQTLWGVSKDPKKALRERPDIYCKKFGYLEGLIYLQSYSITDHNVQTGSYAIDCERPDVLREILAEHGMTIPADESDDTWLDHAQIAKMTPEEADEFMRSIREEYYKRVGKSTEQISVDEFVDEHEDILLGFFGAYYPDMARVANTGDNKSSLQKLANTMLAKSSDQLKPEVIRELMRISNTSKLNDESVRVLDSIVRYATVEELRKYIEPRFAPRDTQIQQTIVHPTERYYAYQDIHRLLADNVHEGVVAGRSYSGCPGNIDLAADVQKEADNDSINLQEAYGGKEKSDEDCEFVSRSCPECGAKNVRTVVKKISETKKRIEGACGCTKVYEKK